MASWRRFRAHQADLYADALQRDLRDVGYSWIVLPLHLRSALRAYYLWRGKATFHLLCRIVLAWCLSIMIAADISNEEVNSPVTVILFFLAIYGGIFTYHAPARIRQHQLVAECAAAIHAAAAAAQACGSDRPDAMHRVSATLQSVERAIFRARRSHRTVARRRRFRHAVLRRHAENVVATLRAAENELDGTSPNRALEELAGLLLRIAGSSAASRTGVLLPDSLTSQYEDVRVRDFELLRTAGVVLVVLGAAATVVVLDVPDIAAVTIIVGVGVLSALAFFGSAWTKMLAILDLMKPG
ncbi:hypothetical protein [Streptomyces parvulus]